MDTTLECPTCQQPVILETLSCTNCNALFPHHCPYCRAMLQPGQALCGDCGREVPIMQRQSARVVQTLLVNERLVRIAACPECGANFDTARRQCPKCSTRLCPECQTILYNEEVVCPRCGTADVPETAESLAEQPATSKSLCPTI